MKKQGFYNHKKSRKLLDQVSDVMRMKHYLSRAELSSDIITNKDFSQNK